MCRDRRLRLQHCGSAQQRSVGGMLPASCTVRVGATAARHTNAPRTIVLAPADQSRCETPGLCIRPICKYCAVNRDTCSQASVHC